jgi:hypothetical protein
MHECFMVHGPFSISAQYGREYEGKEVDIVRP